MQIIKTFLYLFLFISLCFACESATPDQELLVSYTNEDVEKEYMEEVEILYSDSAQVRVRITAPEMYRHLERGDVKQEFTDGIFVEFFDNYNRVTASLQAKYGMRYENAQKVVVQDSVVWKNEDGNQLETEELIWSEREGKITTNRYVEITSPDEIIYGYGFEADQDFSNGFIRAVKGVIRVDELPN